MLEAFLATGIGVSIARAEFITVGLVVAHKGHDTVLDLGHGRSAGGLGECWLLGGWLGGATFGGVGVTRSCADRGTI